MSAILVSPTEPMPLRNLGRSSSLPEQFGVDFLFFAKGLKIGIQRKEFGDLVASLHDGRLGRELALMKRLNLAAVFIEGKPTWTTDGELISKAWGNFNRSQFVGLVISLEVVHKVVVVATNSIEDTISSIRIFQRWCEKEEHGSLLSRPKPAPLYNYRTNKDWGVFLLQSFPGIGHKTASAMFDHFGYVPMRWEVSKEQLMQVEGIGKKRAEEIYAALGNPKDNKKGAAK